jgi:hypothetical protein
VGAAGVPKRPVPPRGGDPLGRRHGSQAARAVRRPIVRMGLLGKQPPC